MNERGASFRADSVGGAVGPVTGGFLRRRVLRRRVLPRRDGRGRRIAGVAAGVAVGVGLVGVREQRAVVRPVADGVVVVVGIAGVALGVTVAVHLVGVREQRAVVRARPRPCRCRRPGRTGRRRRRRPRRPGRCCSTMRQLSAPSTRPSLSSSGSQASPSASGSLLSWSALPTVRQLSVTSSTPSLSSSAIAGVAGAVAVRVHLVGVAGGAAVVGAVRHSVVVVVDVADIALRVAVGVHLVGVRGELAVVGRVRRRRRCRCRCRRRRRGLSPSRLAWLALDGRAAVVGRVDHAVVVVVGVAGVAEAVAVRVGLIGVGDEVAVVGCCRRRRRCRRRCRRRRPASRRRCCSGWRSRLLAQLSLAVLDAVVVAVGLDRGPDVHAEVRARGRQ